MQNTYVLITAAKNEAAFIETTIKSVVRQTLQPKKWIIVSDHSTDGTDDIVNKYSSEYSYISLLKFNGAQDRNFASKVHAISAAFDLLKDLDFDFIGILDADITFEENYYKSFLKTAKEAVRKISSEGKTKAFNLVINNYKEAGQVIPHLHLHIIPRKKGDKVKLN